MSYAGILQLNRNTILENAKILLPVWYTIPVVSWIIALFTKKSTRKNKKKAKKASKPVVPQQTNEEEMHSTHKPVSKKDALIQAAKEVEAEFVPNGSTIEKELTDYRKQWNKMISKQANSDLTEDVNALIRDYVRKVLRTLPAKGFNAERITELAETLCNTPNMKKITEQAAILEYTKLYMVYLVKNM